MLYQYYFRKVLEIKIRKEGSIVGIVNCVLYCYCPFDRFSFGQLATLIKLPSVTGYLVGGLIVGPSLLGVLSPEIIDSLDIVEEVALAFIAFTVGLSFKRSYFKRVGFGPVIIALFESAGAVLVNCYCCITMIGVDLAFAIMLGAIAAATDPASTIMVIKRRQSKRAP